MIKRIILIKAKPGISHQQFRDHYESVHAPLGRRLFPMMSDYRRNYIDRDGARSPAGPMVPDIDVVTELYFRNDDDYKAYLERASDPDVRAQIKADEANFIDLDSVRSYLVQQTV